MKVSELIELLKELPQDSLVCCSSDEEGNSISQVYEVSPYKAMEDGYSYSLIADEDTGPDGYYEESDLIDVVVVWP
jgi:hypothetical protein